jgi:hypothetical protein
MDVGHAVGTAGATEPVLWRPSTIGSCDGVSEPKNKPRVQRLLPATTSEFEGKDHRQMPEEIHFACGGGCWRQS